jgi:hypothetical protein
VLILEVIHVNFKIAYIKKWLYKTNFPTKFNFDKKCIKVFTSLTFVNYRYRLNTHCNFSGYLIIQLIP